MKTKANSKASKAMKLAHKLLKVIPMPQRDNKTWSNCLKQAWNKVKSNTLNIDEIYKEFHTQILFFVNGNTNNIAIAQELTNDTFLKVSENLYMFNPNISKLRTWIYNIAKNIVIDYFRSNNRRLTNTTNIENFTDDKGNEFFTISESKQANEMVENKEVLNSITHAINNLSDKYKQIADLHIIQELTYNEIADVLDISLANTKILIHRTKEKLQAQLKHVHSQI